MGSPEYSASDFNKPTVDIIIPVYGNQALTKLCVDSILNNTNPDEVNFNIYIIDDKPGDRSDDLYQEYMSKIPFMPGGSGHINTRVHYVINQENMGWCKSLNKSIYMFPHGHESQYLCIMNNDTVVSSGWLTKMLENFHDNVAAVGPISNAVAGQQNTSFNKGNKNLIEENVQYLIGFCMLIKRSAIEALITMDGYFIDERFGIGGSEEIDLCIRLRKAGYSLTIDRRVYVHHFCHASLKQVIPDLNAFHIEKHAILVEKWGLDIINYMFPPKPKVLIGIPCLSEDVSGMFFESMLTQNISYIHSWERKVRMMPDQARNALAQVAIDNGFTHVLFIDDDMVLDDQDIINNLIDTAVKKDLDILCTIAHTRNKPYFPCVLKLDPAGTKYVPTDVFGLGVTEVDAAGFSCAIVNVRVFKKLPPPWFEFKKIKILGSVGPQGYGEDIYFSRKAFQHGFKIHVHGDISIWHIGGKILINRDTWLDYNNGMQPMFQKIKMLV